MGKFEQTIFLTGGAGFIGSNYLNKYVLKNPDILYVNIDTLTYAANLGNVQVSGQSNYLFEKADIRDREILDGLFKRYHPTKILHFAAESHVDLSLKNPNIFFETNVLGTHNLLSLALEYKVDRFHLVSTDEVYGALASDDGSFTESHSVCPRNPYSASKAAADITVHAYHETFGLDTIVTRSSNTYGPNQDLTKLMPKFISKLKNNQNVPLYGRGEQMREWMFVEDCIDGIHTAFTNGKSGEVYNVGGGFELSNYELTLKLLEAFGKDETSITFVEDRLGHDFRYSLDITKITSELGWSPKIDFQEGLKRTIESYSTYNE